MVEGQGERKQGESWGIGVIGPSIPRMRGDCCKFKNVLIDQTESEGNLVAGSAIPPHTEDLPEQTSVNGPPLT